MVAGNTFRYEDGSDAHLWVVISDPASHENDQVVFVCLNRFEDGRPGHDPTCILHPGDHPFIKQATFVNYKYVRWMPNDALERLLGYKTISRQDDLAQPVLDAVRRGAGESRYIREKFRLLLIKQGIIE